MNTAARERGYFTYEDLADTPDDGQRYEVIEGVLVVTPAPTNSHQWLVGRLLRQLEDAAPAGWLALSGVAVHGGPDSPVPDVVVGRKLEPLPDAWDPTDILLVAEVVSPGRRRFDMVTKRDAYSRLGIPFYWVIDPTTTPQHLVAFDLATLAIEAEGERELTVTRPFSITVRL